MFLCLCVDVHEFEEVHSKMILRLLKQEQTCGKGRVFVRGIRGLGHVLGRLVVPSNQTVCH